MKKSNQIPSLVEILHAADPDTLIAFLKKHAGRSLALEIKLRTALIRDTRTAEGVNKYAQVLGLLIRHNVHGRVRLTKRSVQLLREVCENFTELQEQFLHEGELREAWECCKPVITQLQMLMDRYHGPDEKLVTHLGTSYRNVELILELAPAPELKQDIHQILLHVSSRSPYVIYDLRYNALNTLFYSARDPKQRKEVLELITSRIQDTSLSSLQRKYWGAMLLKAPDAEIAALKKLSQEELYDIGHLLSVANERGALRHLVRLLPAPDQLSRPQSAQWARWKFDLALDVGGLADIRDTGVELLKLDTHFATYQRIREYLPFEELAGHLAGLPAELLSAVYAEEGRWEMLESVVRAENHPDLLLPYAGMLAEHCQDFPALVRDLVTHFVAHHGGPQCSAMLTQLYEVLKVIRQGDLVYEIATMLATQYPDRFDQPRKRSTTPKVTENQYAGEMK